MSVGTTTLRLTNDDTRGVRPLLGIQWEFTVAAGLPAGCLADFVIDDIHLVSTP